MGLKGLVRSYGAYVRQTNRYNQRLQRQAYKQQIASQRASMQAQSVSLVEEHNQYLSDITSFHKHSIEKINWEEILYSEKPDEPKFSSELEEIARERYKNFKPSFFNTLFQSEEKVRSSYQKGIDKAIHDDKSNYDSQMLEYKQQVEEWEKEKDRAKQVKDLNYKVIDSIIQEIKPFRELEELNIDVKIVDYNNSYWKVEIIVNDTTIIKGYELKALRNGELSSKQMTTSRLNSYMEDVFSSICIRVSRDLFNLFPVGALLVNIKSLSRNETNGKLEPLLVISSLFNREKMEDIDFDYIDPSSFLMTNTKCNSGFKRNKVILTKEVTI